MTTATTTPDHTPDHAAAHPSTHTTALSRPAQATDFAPIPFSRVVGVELRKMFDTRSGFWLMCSIGILSLLATTAVILFAGESNLTYQSFAAAVGLPLAVVLPLIAVLSVTSEWTQRTGLTTFTLVARRGRVIAAKAVCAVGVGVVSMLVAAAIGALGHVVGSALAGTDTVWDVSVVNLALITLANVLGMMIGFMLGVLLRSSAAAIVGYFVYSFVLTGLTEVLAFNQQWFADIRGWVDFNYTQGSLFEGTVSAQRWAELGVSGLFWLVIPLAVGVRLLLRSEVK